MNCSKISFVSLVDRASRLYVMSAFTKKRKIRKIKGVFRARVKTMYNALNLINRALKIKPRNTRALILKGVLLEDIGSELELDALSCYDKAIRIDDTCVEAYEHKADVLTNQMEFKKAIMFYRKAISLSSDEDKHLDSIYDSLASLLKALGKRDEAARVINQGLKRYPKSILLKR